MRSNLSPVRGRCRAWRPAPKPDGHPSGHESGSCRVCWQPCFADRSPGTEFCTQCWLLLAAHPAGRVRSGLASRRDVPLDVLEDLVHEMSAPVAFSARGHLDQITARENRRDTNDRSGSES
ncbi:MAG: hypothetical protein L0H93_02030 [Nocardioides sp.]|nr:hypothetical protein [Nocardioides sp.]